MSSEDNRHLHRKVLPSLAQARQFIAVSSMHTGGTGHAFTSGRRRRSAPRHRGPITDGIDSASSSVIYNSSLVGQGVRLPGEVRSAPCRMRGNQHSARLAGTTTRPEIRPNSRGVAQAACCRFRLPRGRVYRPRAQTSPTSLANCRYALIVLAGKFKVVNMAIMARSGYFPEHSMR